MRSFVILSLLASTYAAPVISPSLNGGSALAPVGQVAGSVQEIAGPALPVVDGAVSAADTVGGLAGTPQPGELLGDVGTVQTVAGAIVKRSPLTEGLSSVPGVDSIAPALGGAAVPVTQSLPAVFGVADKAPAGSAVTSLASSLLSTAEGLGRRALTSVLNAVPGVSSLASTDIEIFRQLLDPVEKVIPKMTSIPLLGSLVPFPAGQNII
jgi:hypothetical protein